ncbi:alpha/beta hydrolase [Chryseolinea sp. T2]|uniref:alpha/beta hydrolase n=1 Tax=Chryseolinea sp. T2 TaxID=3129255 RepID=UPI003076F305
MVRNPPKKRHLYAEWRHLDSVIVLGTLTGELFKRDILITCPINRLEASDVGKWLEDSESEGALLFFHAMWGQQAQFHRKNLRSIDTILGNQPDCGIQTVISFIWHAGGALYTRNWHQASAKGESLGWFIGWICTHFSKVNVLCHSMGSRVFEGALRTSGHHTGIGPRFNTIVLFSPDLDAAVDDPDFVRLRQAARRVVVFRHRRDRLLLLSQWAHRRERLGRSGPRGNIAVAALMSPLSVIDMTQHVRGIQNHTHLDKNWVQQCIGDKLK